MAIRLKTRSSKYRAVRTVVDGVTFASKKEAKRYQELKLLQQAGEIRGLCWQPRFSLVASPPHGAAPTHIGTYVADFVYTDKHGTEIVEDVKSPATRTALYKWKKRHTEIQFGIQIVET